MDRIVVACLYLALAAYAIVLSIREPYHNWDALGYVAAAKALETDDIGAVHTFTFDELRRALPADVYEDMAREKHLGTGPGAAYRRAVSSDVSIFAEQLQYYQIRVLYVALVYVFYKLGVDIEFATHFVSGLAVAASLILLWRLSARRLRRPFNYCLPLLAALCGILQLARLSTPDGLALFVLVIVAYALAEARLAMLCAASLAAVLVRTDLVLFTLPLLALLAILHKDSRWLLLSAMAGSVAIYAAVNAHYHHAAWSTIVYFATIARWQRPISDPPPLSLQQYVEVLGAGTAGLLTDPMFLAYLAATAVSIALLWIAARSQSWRCVLRQPQALLVAACLSDALVSFLALPALWDRLFVRLYVVSAFALLWLFSDWLRARRPTRAPALPSSALEMPHMNRP
ncbi:MAG TPA: hypothetical protein VF132_06390 [Rudaea sp.]